MKKFIIEYIKIIGYTVIGIIFAYSSFYLLLNFYHAKELKRSFSYDAKEDSNYMSVLEKMDQVQINLTQFNAANYKGSVPVHYLLNIQGRLENCRKQFSNEAYLNLQNKQEITFQEVGNLRDSFQNNILSTCLVEQLYDMAVTDETDRFPIASLKRIAPYVELNIKELLNSTNYLSTDLLNNSIYHFTTEHTNNNLFNKLKFSYSELLSSYNKSADLLLQLSEWFVMEIGG